MPVTILKNTTNIETSVDYKQQIEKFKTIEKSLDCKAVIWITSLSVTVISMSKQLISYKHQTASIVFLLGLELLSSNLNAQQNIQIETSEAIEEIIISGTKTQDFTMMDEETERLFSIAGAADDPLQAIYSLPGVTFSDDGEPVIRGSAPRDNAFYIDMIPARYLFHIFGNSIFNKNLIQNFELYPSAFPSQFGNATGGIIDVTLREPKNQPFTTTFNWSFLITGIMVESAVTENQAFYGSYRRSLIDLFFDRFYSDKEEEKNKKNEGISIGNFPVAEDYQLKYVWTPDNQNKVSIVAAGASDDLEITFYENNNAAARDPDLVGALGFDQGFDSQGIIWDWQTEAKDKQLNTRITHSSDYFDLIYGVDQSILTKAQRYIVRSDYTQHVFNSHWITTGFNHEESSYNINFNAKIASCSEFEADCPTIDIEYKQYKDQITVNTNSFFLEDNFSITEQFWLTIGIHYSADNYLHEQRTEPRLRADFLFTENLSTYVATGKYSQLPELETMLPVIGNPQLTTEKANHYVWGLEQQLNDGWNWKTDFYYKDKYDVVRSINDTNDPDYGLNYNNKAEGKAYGIELIINKNRTDNWYGWIALTLGKAEQTNLYTDETTPFKYDKPIMLDIILNRQLTERWMVGIKWSFESGALYTPIIDLKPNAKDPEILEPIYGEQNSERLPFYHRLDVRAEYKIAKTWGYWSFHADVINAYGQKNVQGYEYAPSGKDTLSSPPDGFGDNIPVKEKTSKQIFPSIGFEVQF